MRSSRALNHSYVQTNLRGPGTERRPKPFVRFIAGLTRFSTCGRTRACSGVRLRPLSKLWLHLPCVSDCKAPDAAERYAACGVPDSEVNGLAHWARWPAGKLASSAATS